jgi:hypothetical protein
MLRVITERVGDRFRLDLHGTLGGEWVAVLQQHWRAIVDEVPEGSVTVTLADVDFVDPGGEQLLREMAEHGVLFAAAGCMNRYFIDSLTSGVRMAEGGRR